MGQTKMDRKKVAAYRSRLGVDEFDLKESGGSVISGTPEQQPKPRLVFHGYSKDTAVSEFEDLAAQFQFGPGTELKKILQKFGVPPCADCDSLALVMNQWGPGVCRQRVEDLVDDMLPRAVTWMSQEHPWAHRLLKGVVEKSAIKITLRKYIHQAIDAYVKSVENGTQNEKNHREARLKQIRLQASQPRRKKGGCSGCGGGKRARRVSGSSKPTLGRGVRPDISNLTFSTAFGRYADTGHKDVKDVKSTPFDGETIRNLIYHIYPTGPHWKWNLDQLIRHIDQFNGRRIVGIAVDNESASADEVRRYLGGHVYEYMVFKNSKNFGEMTSFMPLIQQLETRDPNHITFRGHAKGVSQVTKVVPHIMGWVEMLYTTNLGDPGLVERQLRSNAVTGACRKWDLFYKSRKTLSYSGSMYWFRNHWLYSRSWQSVVLARWGCEEYPGRLFRPEESAVTCLDNTGSMYSAAYYRDKVLPTYEKWLEARGMSLSDRKLPKGVKA